MKRPPMNRKRISTSRIYTTGVDDCRFIFLQRYSSTVEDFVYFKKNNEGIHCGFCKEIWCWRFCENKLIFLLIKLKAEINQA